VVDLIESESCDGKRTAEINIRVENRGNRNGELSAYYVITFAMLPPPMLR